jgi:hypothetical protein
MGLLWIVWVGKDIKSELFIPIKCSDGFQEDAVFSQALRRYIMNRENMLEFVLQKIAKQLAFQVKSAVLFNLYSCKWNNPCVWNLYFFSCCEFCQNVLDLQDSNVLHWPTVPHPYNIVSRFKGQLECVFRISQCWSSTYFKPVLISYTFFASVETYFSSYSRNCWRVIKLFPNILRFNVYLLWSSPLWCWRNMLV